jgi:hypothetical protein
MHTRSKFVLYILSFAILFLGSFSLASAASIGFRPNGGTYKVGDTINVVVYVDSGGESINAVSAKVNFSTDTMSASSVSKFGSIINLWAQEPTYSNSGGNASFEGVVLSGYNGSFGNTATISFKAKSVGVARLSFASASVLANDGSGTDVLTSRGSASFNIEAASTPVKVTPPPAKPAETPDEKPIVKKNSNIKIEEIKDVELKSGNKRFLITPPDAVSGSYTIQIDGDDPVSWTDDGTHIYDAPVLLSGEHTIKVLAKSKSGEPMSGYYNFSTVILSAPVINNIKDIYLGDLLVLSGTADPLVEVELNITNVENNKVLSAHLQPNSDGAFTYAGPEALPEGTYSIAARTSTKTGIFSDYMKPATFKVKDHFLSSLIAQVNKYLSLVTILVGLVLLLCFTIAYGLYHFRNFNAYLKRRLAKTQVLVKKSFDILDEDADQELTIIKKIRSGKTLERGEQVFLGKLKKDIESAERVITKDLNNIG